MIRPARLIRTVGAVAMAIAVAATFAIGASTVSAPEAKAKALSPIRALEERYFVEFLERNPVTATYLGGDSWRSDLAPIGGRLRDFSSVSLREEDSINIEILGKLRALQPSVLSPEESIDSAVIQAQIRFLHEMIVERRYHLRSLETYMVEPFRGVDWALQGMSETAPGSFGTREEWSRVLERVRSIPDYLSIAQGNLKSGVSAGIVPDWRMIEKDGLATPVSNAAYFEKTLPELFDQRTKGQTWSVPLSAQIGKAGADAARAYRDFRGFILGAFYTKEGAKALAGGETPGTGIFRTRELLRPEFRKDNFAFGEPAYTRAVKENLRIAKPVAALYDESDGIVKATQDALMEVARRVAGSRSWDLPWSERASSLASTRQVLNRLGEEAPKDDAEMLEWYRKRSFDLVEYGRKHRLFDIPETYRLDVTETPEVLRASIDGAAYYPAPPFKGTGVGRFYLTPTGNDPAHLKENNRSALADLCAHEGFPGHDWHYQFMNARASSIGKVRWLTPGAVEDASSMWADSMLSEGWALYAEALMAEPREEAPDGFYTPEEKIYQLQGQLLRDVRVRVDIGIHTGRLSFEEAVEYYAANVDFAPNACARTEDEARAACETATRAIYRYSKWPTQAITYHLGKREILNLREEVRKIQGDRFDLKAFHEKILGVGTIPLSHVRPRILEWAKTGPDS